MTLGRFTVLFVVLAIADLFMVYTDGAWRSVTKPLIMLSLIFYYCKEVRNRDRNFFIFLLALIAALGGDVFLLFKNGFLFGLTSFLIMQVLYFVTFVKDYQQRLSNLFFAFGIIAAGGLVMNVLYPYLGEMKIPVFIYMISILAMTWAAFAREHHLHGYRLVLTGSLLFVVSDSVLALHHFETGMELGKLTVMMTYAIAQYYIVIGIIQSRQGELK